VGCASTGAIEVSDGPDRLIVSCGGADLAGVLVPEELAQGLRSTAAHSTLILDERNSTAILHDGTLGKGVTEVELHRQELENGSRIEVSHDGYVRRLGYMHRRLLLVSNDGRDIRGEDMLLPSQRRRKTGRGALCAALPSRAPCGCIAHGGRAGCAAAHRHGGAMAVSRRGGQALDRGEPVGRWPRPAARPSRCATPA
jgi:uncharacterized heparinase superfamily protein